MRECTNALTTVRTTQEMPGQVRKHLSGSMYKCGRLYKKRDLLTDYQKSNNKYEIDFKKIDATGSK